MVDCFVTFSAQEERKSLTILRLTCYVSKPFKLLNSYLKLGLAPSIPSQWVPLFTGLHANAKRISVFFYLCYLDWSERRMLLASLWNRVVLASAIEFSSLHLCLSIRGSILH